MAAGPLFVIVEKYVKPSHGTQEKGLKCTENYKKSWCLQTYKLEIFFVKTIAISYTEILICDLFSC